MIYPTLNRLQKKLLTAFLVCLLCWLSFFAPVTSAESVPLPEQTQAVYTITEKELTQFENNLVSLKAINERLQVDLKVQSEEAKALKQEVTALKKQLEQLRSLSQKQDESLMNANSLLEKYAIEAKRERLRIKAQRNAWEAVAACALIAFVAK